MPGSDLRLGVEVAVESSATAGKRCAYSDTAEGEGRSRGCGLELELPAPELPSGVGVFVCIAPKPKALGEPEELGEGATGCRSNTIWVKVV